MIAGDREEMLRLFENLIENALKYGASGGRVIVSMNSAAAPDGTPEIRILVRDFGPGIAPEHLPRLTERFYRVDVGDSRSQGGTGLGLSLVKHILNRHRGRLLIESVPKQGATFTACFPQVRTSGFSLKSKSFQWLRLLSSDCHETFVKAQPTAPKGAARGARSGADGASLPCMETSMNFLKTIVAAGLVAASTTVAFAADITGAGATFPFPIYSKWADAYKKETGNGLNYQSIGSGGGIKQIQAKTVTFGATDAPLKAEQLEKDGLVQWPMVMGCHRSRRQPRGCQAGRAGVRRRDACQRLSRQDHQVGRRCHQEAQSEREAAVGRDHGRPPFGRVGHHLQLHKTISPKASADWKSKVGEGTAVEWPVGVGAKGNEGVSGNIGQTKNSIGYVEYAYAKQNKLTYTGLVNKAGKTVQPTVEAFQGGRVQCRLGQGSGFTSS